MLFIVLCHTVNDFASKIKPVARGIDRSHGLQKACNFGFYRRRMCWLKKMLTVCAHPRASARVRGSQEILQPALAMQVASCKKA